MPDVLTTPAYRWVGHNPPRKESLEKVTGSAKYLDDLKFEGCLHGKTVRSTVPHGRIKKISFEPGVPWDEFTVVTARDIPGITDKDWNTPIVNACLKLICSRFFIG